MKVREYLTQWLAEKIAVNYEMAMTEETDEAMNTRLAFVNAYEEVLRKVKSLKVKENGKRKE